VMDHNPRRAIAVLEAVLSQEQANAVERALCPEPSAAEKREGLLQVEVALLRLGLADNDGLVQAVRARAESLRNVD